MGVLPPSTYRAVFFHSAVKILAPLSPLSFIPNKSVSHCYFSRWTVCLDWIPSLLPFLTLCPWPRLSCGALLHYTATFPQLYPFPNCYMFRFLLPRENLSVSFLLFVISAFVSRFFRRVVYNLISSFPHLSFTPQSIAICFATLLKQCSLGWPRNTSNHF